MNLPSVVQAFLDRLQAGVGVRTVYGEPIVAQQRTIVPVAKVAFGFGGGFGTGPDGRTERPPGEGAGGGGAVTTRPVGVVEITPAGTRFIPIHDTRRLAGAFFLGLALGFALRRRRSTA